MTGESREGHGRSLTYSSPASVDPPAFGTRPSLGWNGGDGITSAAMSSSSSLLASSMEQATRSNSRSSSLASSDLSSASAFDRPASRSRSDATLSLRRMTHDVHPWCEPGK